MLFVFTLLGIAYCDIRKEKITMFDTNGNANVTTINDTIHYATRMCISPLLLTHLRKIMVIAGCFKFTTDTA